MAAEDPIALKEIQLRLGVPQHILIHLCEKGVIEPDFADTSGRGKRREFSQRNLFEFGVALALRAFDLPVLTAAFVVRLLRAFERATAKLVPGFELVSVLLEKGFELRLHIVDGRVLVFDASGKGLKRRLLLAAEIGDLSKGVPAKPRVEKLSELPPEYDGRLEINLSHIAQKTLK
ncbi:MAG TPA: hypothetical protein VHO25_03465 [Polyangiaceae bacterium]|nr:hypothetical protein [Polyangiaceae bacterium]